MKIPAMFNRSVLGRAIWGFKREFVWVGVFSLFANVLMIAPTLYMLQVFDRVMLSRSETTLLFLTLVVLLFFAVMAFSEWVRSRLLVRTGVRFDELVSNMIFNASFESRLKSGSSKGAQAFSDLTQIRQFATGVGIFAFFDSPWTPVYLAVLFMMHPLLGYTSVFFMVLLLAFAFFGSKFTEPALESAMLAGQEANEFLGVKLRNAEVVESLGMLANLRRKWLYYYEKHLSLHTHSQERMHQVQALTKLVRYSQQSIVLAVGAYLVIHDNLSPAAMVAANMLMANALKPIDTISAAWRSFVLAKKAYFDLETLLEENPAKEAGLPVYKFEGNLQLQGLTATASSQKHVILNELNANFPAGQVVAITGPSGAGKSTLIRCLLGIWKEHTGQVLLDGQPLNGWSREDLGPYIGYLPQDIELFEGTIAENISRFGELKPEWVIDAAKQVGIHDMVLRFPQGYDTPIGESGGLLSGGQRQRVALARALYGNPRMLFLDEPNANLDDAGEVALARAIKHMKQQGASVFMVVHQKGILSVADRQVVVNQGRIVQDSLLKPNQI